MKRLSLAVALSDAHSESLPRLLADCELAGFGKTEEVVVAVPKPPSGLQDVAKLFEGRPNARLVTLDGDPSLLSLWGVAMAESAGDYVAVVDGRDRISETWLRAFRALVEPDIVCGPVDPPQGANSTTVAAYLSEYGQFQGPLECVRMAEYPGNNIVFRRALLPSPDSLRRDGFWKTFHVEQLRKQLGKLPIVVNDALSVRFDRRYALTSYVSRRYVHGRCYGGQRLRQPNPPSRLACLLFTPALPALRTARVLGRTLGKAGAPRRLLYAAIPLVLGEVSWSFGEAAGYAFGPGDCCARVT